MTVNAAQSRSTEYRVVRVLIFLWTGVVLGLAGCMAVATQWFALALGDSAPPQALIILAFAVVAGALHLATALSAGLVMSGFLYASSEGSPFVAPAILVGALIGLWLGSTIRSARRRSEELN